MTKDNPYVFMLVRLILPKFTKWNGLGFLKYFFCHKQFAVKIPDRKAKHLSQRNSPQVPI
jgi:hypothetical protein